MRGWVGERVSECEGGYLVLSCGEDVMSSRELIPDDGTWAWLAADGGKL